MEVPMRIRYLIATVILSVFLTSCSCATSEATPTNNAFTEFTDELFRSQSGSDSLTLGYTLAHPENYGITDLPKGFSSFSFEDLKKEALSLENLLAALKQFDKNSLSFEQQVLYVRGYVRIRYTGAKLSCLLGKLRPDHRNPGAASRPAGRVPD